MKTTYSFKSLLLIILFVASGCESFIETDTPNSQIIGAEVFEDTETAEAALQENYIRLRDQVLITGTGTGMGALMGLYTDELQNWRVNNVTDQSFYTNKVSPADGTLSQIWNNCYKLVYNCNRILEGLDKSQGIPTEIKQRMKGETLAIRSIVYFYMVQLFGQIPYVTTTDFKFNSTIHKTAPEVLYERILNDTQIAYNLLDGHAIIKTKINQDVVAAFLSRMYLYLNNWQKAIQYSNQIIESNRYRLEDDVNNVFLKESNGVIWHLKAQAEGNNTHEGKYFIFTSAPPPSISLTTNLVEAFAPEDLRKKYWIKSIQNDQTTTYFHAYKYKEKQSTSSSKEYSVVFRLEEAYYNRLESYIYIGRNDLALTDWNLLRERYGLPLYSEIPADWKEQLLRERRLEFFCEFGFRFFDLKRTGKLSDEMLKSKSQWHKHYDLLPLPQSELLLNPNLLPQNEGY